MGPDSLPCPECGFENPLDAEYCEGCDKHITQEGVDLSTLSGSPSDDEPYTVAFVCPKCGQPSDLVTPDCLRCGIIFAKWYEGLDDLSVEEAEQLARLRAIQAERERAAEAENRRIEAQRKAELERQREAIKRRKAQIQAQRQAEAAARQKAEEEARRRTEAAKRQRAQEEARQKAEAEKRRRAEEEERQKAEATKQEKAFSMQQILKALRPKGRLSDLLRKYENRPVDLKRGPDEPLEALTLLRALEDYIVLHAEDTSQLVHIPLGRIDRIEENLDSQNGTSEANGTLVIVLIGSA